MLVGILSDTHDHVAPTTTALNLLRQAGAEYYIHCGDVGGTAIFDLLAGLPLAFVWGNTDYDRVELQGYAESLQLTCHDELAELELGGAHIAVTHGDNAHVLRQIISGRKHQYLVHGHTHVARDQVLNGLRWINPGAVHRSPRPSVAVLDTVTEKLRFIYLKDAR